MLALVALVGGGIAWARPAAGDTPSSASDRFWGATWARGSFQTYADAGLAAAASDAVVVGTILSVEPGRTVKAAPDLGEDGVLAFATAHVKVSDVLAGKYAPAPDVTLTLELFLPLPSAVTAMISGVPTERTILFLRLSPSGGKDVYALLNPETMIRDLPDSRTLPWAEEPWLLALGDTSFDATVSQVRAEQ